MRYLCYAITGLVLGFAFINPLPGEARETFPQCENEKVLRKVVKRFNQTERIYWEERGLSLERISGPHLHNDHYLPESPINRRYCHATAHFQNGKRRRMHYLIEEGAGFAGFGWNVEYCIHGLDPWKYYDGRCRVLSR
ncbi:MAG: hypothetical protein JJ891_09915 [Rhizobiaceae bacterium]|nr:hypothetical protein [Rhizobiaceae bacterium]